MAPTIKSHKYRTAMIVLGSILAAFLVIRMVVPLVVKEKLLSTMRAGCSACVFKIQDIDLAILRGKIVLKGAKFRSPEGKPVIFDLSIGRLYLNFDSGKLLRGDIDLQVARATDVIFDVTEDKSIVVKEADPLGGDVLASLPAISVDAMEVENGELIYKMMVRGIPAPIRITKMNIKTGPMGTRKDLAPESFWFQVTGSLEDSGSTQLIAKVDLFTDDNHDELTLELKDHDVSGLSRFLKVADGLTLTGKIDLAAASLKIRRGNLTGVLASKYRGLRMEWVPTRDRPAIDNFFHRILVDIVLEHQGSVQTSIKQKRAPGRSIFNFILDGIMPGIMKIIRTPPGSAARAKK